MRNINLILLIAFFSIAALGQTVYEKASGVTIQSYSNLTGLPLIVSVNSSKSVTIEKFPEWIQTNFLQDEKTFLKFIKKENDQLGMKHYRFEQHYNQIKIENTMVIAHCNGNILQSFNGDWFKKINVLNEKSVTETQALAFALAKVNAKKYKWHDKALQEHMRKVLKDPNFTYLPKGELVVLPTTDKKTKITTFLYAYKFNIYAEVPLYRANVYVDATTGNIIKEQNLICTADVPGVANTKFSGTQTLTVNNYSVGAYRLTETGRGNGIETYNLNNGVNYVNTNFTNSSTSWTSTGPNQVATDAHWGAEKTYDFYFNTFNRNSIDDNGFALLSYVHYDVNFINAFWDGQAMTYGDGKLSSGYKEFTALDVCGHEITHGVVQQTAMLNGGESDALNEAFADIFGTAVEWYARPSQHNWLLGDELKTNGVALRNMSNPSLLGQPDTYFGNNWDFADEPHTNDGPCIYWYYLLSVGGAGTNDNGQIYNITGITMAKASAIAYRALTLYMTPNTDYANVRAFAIQAAKDLYGQCSNEVIQTTNAWYAVGVGNQISGNSIGPDFSADVQQSCILPTTVTFTNQTNNGVNYKWHFGDGTNSTVLNPAHTYTANGVYSVKLVATGCIAGSKDSLLKIAYIDVNTANPCTYVMQTGSTFSACAGTLYDDGGVNGNYTDNNTKEVTIISAPGDILTVKFYSFGMEYNFDYLRVYKGSSASGTLIGNYTGNSLPNNGLGILTNTNVITIVQIADPYLNELGFEMRWTCTTPTPTTSSVGMEIIESNQEILLYPNPTENLLTISNITHINLIEVTSAMGQKLETVKANDTPSITINTSQLADGIYFVKLYSLEGCTIKKIIKR